MTVSFLTEGGRFLARGTGPVSGNVLVRREQYRRADNQDISTDISRSIIAGKIANSRSVLQRAIRDHNEKIDAEKIRASSMRLSYSIKELQKVLLLDVLRGIEGGCGFHVFQCFRPSDCISKK